MSCVHELPIRLPMMGGNYTKSALIAFRSFSSKPRESLLILGNSNVGWGIAQEGIKRGYRVLITTRRNLDTFAKNKNIEYINTPERFLTNQNYWKDIARFHFKKGERLLVVNTIGGSIPSSNGTIEDLNINIPLAAIKGITDGVNNGTSLDKYNVIHLSTMAAGLKAPYGKTKREVELRLLELPLSHLTIFRMGYAVEALIGNTMTQTYKSHHRLSLEEMTLLPIQFLIGGPSQYNKVLVPLVSIDDVATAIFNVFNRPVQGKIIDAVNRENITQEQFCRFHTDLLGKKFRPIYIPIESANKLVKHHTFGHLVSYAIEYCAMEHNIRLDPEEFAKLVGKPLKTLSEMYTLLPHQELIIPRPPLVEFAIYIIRNLWNKPESLLDTFKAMIIMAKSLLRDKNTFLLQPIQNPAPKTGYRWKSVSEENFNSISESNRCSESNRSYDH